MNKDLYDIAERLLEIESEIKKGTNVAENEQEIEKIISQLSMEEVFEIDDYIMNIK